MAATRIKISKCWNSILLGTQYTYTWLSQLAVIFFLVFGLVACSKKQFGVNLDGHPGDEFTLSIGEEIELSTGIDLDGDGDHDIKASVEVDNLIGGIFSSDEVTEDKS